MNTTRTTKRAVMAALLCSAGLATAPAHAIIPVTDVAALAALLQEVAAWAEQLRSMETQLTQMRDTYASMTGLRGMEQVLRISDAARNYLPTDWAAFQSALGSAASAYPQLSAAVRAQTAANAVLDQAAIGRYSAGLQALLAAQRQAVAGDQAVTRLAYSHSSDRFSSLATLIDRIGTTQDGKAIAELQGRIGAEQAMLANEGVKLAAMSQSSAAEAAARQLALREQVVANHGSFATRLQPVLPAP